MPKLCDVYHYDGTTDSGDITTLDLSALFGKTFDRTRTYIIVTNGAGTLNESDPGYWKLSYILVDGDNLTLSTYAENAVPYHLQLIEFTTASGIKVYRNSGTVDSGTPEVDTIGATIILANCHVDVNGLGDTANFQGRHFIHAKITSTTQVTITVGESTSRVYNWQVVDWNGYCKVLHVDDTVGSGTGNHDITVAGSDVDWEKRAIIGSSYSAETNIGFEHVYRVFSLSNTTLHVQRGASGKAFEVTYEVIEFTSSDWEVQLPGGAIDDGDLEDDIGISSVGTARAFILPGGMMQWNTRIDTSGSLGWYDDAGIIYKFTSATNVNVERINSDDDTFQSMSIIEDVGIGVAGNPYYSYRQQG